MIVLLFIVTILAMFLTRELNKGKDYEIGPIR